MVLNGFNTVQIAALEAALTADHSSLLGFCHNDLQYGNMLLHTASHRSLSMDSIASHHSVERAVRGSSPPPRGASPVGGRSGGARGTSPEPGGCAAPFLAVDMMGQSWGVWKSRIIPFYMPFYVIVRGDNEMEL